MPHERDQTVSPRPWFGDERRAAWSGVDQAHVMGMELIAATLTWAGIGYLLDGWIGTTPWLLVVGAILGNAAGIYLVWLRSNRMEGGSAYTGPSVDRASVDRASSGAASAERTSADRASADRSGVGTPIVGIANGGSADG